MSIIPAKRFLPVVFLLLLATGAFSQLRIVSPYSRFGIGDLADNNNAWNLSVGQLGIGMRSPFHVNYANPASYTAFDSLSFVFEGGINSEFVTLRNETQSVSRGYGSLGSLLFGMPITRWWRTSIGLVPYSDVGYNMSNYTTDKVERLYSGSGGINRLYWGNGVKLFKGLSIGANFSYLFGSMDREAAVQFPDSLYALNFRESYHITLSDLWFNLGAQYTFRTKSGLDLNFGAIFSPSRNLTARTDMLSTTYLLSTSGIESQRDTLVNRSGSKGKINIPAMAGAGVSIEKADYWMAGIDFKWQNWEKFLAFGKSDSLVNSWQVNLGGEIIPDINKYNNYLARMRYRLGFNFSKTYLRLRGQDLNEYGLTFGLGFPIRGMKTMLNVSGQYGVRGTTSNQLIRESYFRLVVGFSIYERWFVKRKYF